MPQNLILQDGPGSVVEDELLDFASNFQGDYYYSSPSYFTWDYDAQQAIYNSGSQIYDEFQTPILGMVLYFLMQLPYIQKLFIRNIPSLFNKDGFHTLPGYLVQSTIFGLTFYSLNSLSNYLSVL